MQLMACKGRNCTMGTNNHPPTIMHKVLPSRYKNKRKYAGHDFGKENQLFY